VLLGPVNLQNLRGTVVAMAMDARHFKGRSKAFGPSSHYEVIPVNGAGGARRVAGDYRYRTQDRFNSMAASGRIFRVTP